MSADGQSEESHEPCDNLRPEGGAAEHGEVLLGDRDDLHIGDYVGFERITTNKDWRLALGKVISFPCKRFVKIAYYDPVNRETVTQDPISEEVIRKKAEEDGKMEIWHDRAALNDERLAAVDEEKEATQSLFSARDGTLAKQATVAGMTKASVKELKAARKLLKTIPVRQWRDLRTRGEPVENIARLVRSVMLVLYEDKAASWEEMEPILKDPKFMDRLVTWDCSLTPMSRPRRNKILSLCSGEDLGLSTMAFSGRRGSSSSRSGRRSPGPASARAEGAPAQVAPRGTEIGSFASLDSVLRAWVNAQLACSEAAENQERIIDECFAEQQEQRVQLRKVNDMRTNISRIEVQMQESKCAIMGTDPNPNPIMPLEQYPTDTIFYKRVHANTEGRFVQEIVLRDAIVINFGPIASEDADGYVRLTRPQADALRSTVHQAYIKHDAEEMQDLLTRKEREEDEIAQLRSRIDALRGQPNVSDDEFEELAQLERLLEDAERRHRSTLTRIAELYACGRGAREITMASKRIEAVYTRLHLKMAGDWTTILDDPQRCEEMREALRDDVCKLLSVQRTDVFDIDARNGSLLIDFTVKHGGEMDADELQDLINNADFSALSLFYEKVTFKKTGPMNTPEQEAQYAEEMRLLEESHKRENFSGMGIKEKLDDYYNADGTLDEEFGELTRNDVDYRKAIITIPITHEDYEEYALVGPDELHPRYESVAAPSLNSTMQDAPRDMNATQPKDTTDPSGTMQTGANGLTRTHGESDDEEADGARATSSHPSADEVKEVLVGGDEL